MLDQYGTPGGSPILATSAASKGCLVLSAGILNRFSLVNPRIRDWRIGGVEYRFSDRGKRVCCICVLCDYVYFSPALSFSFDVIRITYVPSLEVVEL